MTAIPREGRGAPTLTFYHWNSGDMLKWLERMGPTHNLYFCINPTFRPDMQKKPTKEDIKQVAFLHVDLDPREGETLAESRARNLALLTSALPEGVPPPTCIVDSGGGYWGFWRLKDPIELDGSRAKAEEEERYNRELARLFRADHCHNVDRIARLPGTVNWPNEEKRAKGRTEALAALVEWNPDNVYDLSEFPATSPKVHPQGSKVAAVDIDTANVRRFASVDDIPELKGDGDARKAKCRLYIVHGRDPDHEPKSRSEPLHFVCCQMARAGCSDEVIYAVITDPKFGISESVLDKGSGAEAYAIRQIEQARKKAAADAERAELILDPGDPLPSARFYMARCAPNLLRYNGDWLDYGGAAYAEVEPEIIKARLFAFLERAKRLGRKDKEWEVVPFKPTGHDVNEVRGALEAVTVKPRDLFKPPCWIGEPGPPPREVISCANGLLHLPTGALLPATPSFFTRNALEIAFDASAQTPATWLAFLGQLWAGDPESIAVLQEVFGYLLVPDTSQQKVFMLVGPARSGKGTIGRILRRLVGEANVVGSNMKSLGENFGLEPLIGKQLAMVSDMRLGKRTDPAAIAENLLRISGEDVVSANRKNKTFWTGTLAVRFLIMTNELPKFSDASGALANRFVPLVMTESFLGREDHGLTDKLVAELPGILNWAIEGWRRLQARGFFVLPGSAREVIQDLLDMASPVAAFIRERCDLDPEAAVEKVLLYAAWREWCLARGEPIDEDTVFARNLYAATRGRVRARKMPRPQRVPAYVGIRLRDAGADGLDPDVLVGRAESAHASAQPRPTDVPE